MLSTHDPLETERTNELRSELWARRTEMQRAHAELDRLALPTRDQFGERYDLPARILRMQLDFVEIGVIAETYRRDLLSLKEQLHASERRRVKLEHALSVMRRVNEVLDALEAVRREFARIKRTIVRLIGRTASGRAREVSR